MGCGVSPTPLSQAAPGPHQREAGQPSVPKGGPWTLKKQQLLRSLLPSLAVRREAFTNNSGTINIDWAVLFAATR